MKVLVTGGFGYVGGRLAQALSAEGHSVVLGTRRAQSSPHWLPGCEVVCLDWNDPHQLTTASTGVNAVAHLAGMNARDCQRDPVAALEFNGAATARLLHAAIAARVERFLYVSTAHVYASPLRDTLTEMTCPASLHPYATSHRAGEDTVRAAHRSGRTLGIVVRLSNAVGAPAHPGADCWMLVAQDLTRQAVQTSRIVLTSSGAQRRDFIAVSEVCAALAHLLTLPADGIGDGLFNLGGDCSLTVLELAERIAHRVEAVTGNRPSIERRATDPPDESADLRFERQKLLDTGFVPAPGDSVDREIDELIRFCLAHRADER